MAANVDLYQNELRRLITDPSSFSGSPGFRFALDQGTQAISRASSANRGSGNVLAELMKYGTAVECFERLKSGDVDALIVALPSATWLINQTNASAYSFVPLSGTGIDLCAAVAAGNGMLADIMSKGISKSNGLFDGIVANNTGSDNTLQATVSRIPAAGIVIFAAVMVMMVMFLHLFKT